jgi:seryl-tRNA synthetase
MFSISLRNARETRHYSISSLGNLGWEVKLEEAGEITRHVYYHDWHRVERALALFQLEVSNLTEHGWQPVSLPDVELSSSAGQ